MKKVFMIFVVAVMASSMAVAAGDNYEEGLSLLALRDSTKTPKGSWTTSSTPALKIDQKYYDNWSSSGNSQIALTTTFFGNYKYTHSKFIWDNVADLAFGYNWQDLDGDTTMRGLRALESRRKSEDKIDLTSTFSMKLKSAWNVNASMNFKSQFGNGYVYSGTGLLQTEEIVSGFMAPAYLTTAIGFEKKYDNWNVSLSFLTGKTTFVYNDSLIARGYDYGVLQDKSDDDYEHVYFGLGSYVKFFYKKDIVKNLNLYTRLELFYDYRKPGTLSWKTLDDQLSNGDIAQIEYDEMIGKNWLGRRAFETDLAWEVTLNYRFSSFLAAYFSLNMKYDTDFAGMGRLDRWQVFQNAGIQVYFNWKTPRS